MTSGLGFFQLNACSVIEYISVHSHVMRLLTKLMFPCDRGQCNTTIQICAFKVLRNVL